MNIFAMIYENPIHVLVAFSVVFALALAALRKKIGATENLRYVALGALVTLGASSIALSYYGLNQNLPFLDQALLAISIFILCLFWSRNSAALFLMYYSTYYIWKVHVWTAPTTSHPSLPVRALLTLCTIFLGAFIYTGPETKDGKVPSKMPYAHKVFSATVVVITYLAITLLIHSSTSSGSFVLQNPRITLPSSAYSS